MTTQRANCQALGPAINVLATRRWFNPARPSKTMAGSNTNDKERLMEILTEVLGSHLLRSSSKAGGVTLDELTEAVDYLAEEILQQGIVLPSPLTAVEVESNSVPTRIDDALSELLSGEPTLEALEAHPLYSVTLTTLEEILVIDTSKASQLAPEIVEDTLKAALQPVSLPPDPSTQKAKHKKGTLGECELCERSMPLTEHHLIPRSEHHRLASQGAYTLMEMRSRLAMLCRPCHSAIHSMISHEDLAGRFNTMELLLQHEGVCKWGNYASKLKERRAGFESFGLRNKR